VDLEREDGVVVAGRLVDEAAAERERERDGPEDGDRRPVELGDVKYVFAGTTRVTTVHVSCASVAVAVAAPAAETATGPTTRSGVDDVLPLRKSRNSTCAFVRSPSEPSAAWCTVAASGTDAVADEVGKNRPPVYATVASSFVTVIVSVLVTVVVPSDAVTCAA
jgi:hypothetical protein